jgi:predicted SAM-dependent methyltransferase
MESLRALLRQLYFEDNPALGRRASRVASLGRKTAALLPHLVAFSHFNFGSAFPAPPSRSLEPKPRAVALLPILGVGRRDEFERSVTLFEGWCHPGEGDERGLPYADGSCLAIEVGDVLGHVPDAVFALRELHRVAAPGARIDIAIPDAVAQRPGRDPTRRRIVTRETFEFFGEHAAVGDDPLSVRSRHLRASGLFAFRSAGERNSGSGEIVCLEARKDRASRPSPLRIDLGCGRAPRPGYEGVDRLAMPGVDVVRDIDRHGLPFSDSTITHVWSSHFLEHVHDLVFVMNEIHRVCCDDALVELAVPTLLGPWAAADPTHVRLFNARSFQYFEEQGVQVNGAPAGDQAYAGIVPGFEILEQRLSFTLYVALRVRKPEQPR